MQASTEPSPTPLSNMPQRVPSSHERSTCGACRMLRGGGGEAGGDGGASFPLHHPLYPRAGTVAGRPGLPRPVTRTRQAILLHSTVRYNYCTAHPFRETKLITCNMITLPPRPPPPRPSVWPSRAARRPTPLAAQAASDRKRPNRPTALPTRGVGGSLIATATTASLPEPPPPPLRPPPVCIACFGSDPIEDPSSPVEARRQIERPSRRASTGPR